MSRYALQNQRFTSTIASRQSHNEAVNYCAEGQQPEQSGLVLPAPLKP